MAAQVTLPVRWQDDNNDLADEPSAFAYFELVTEAGSFIEIGGGRGANRYRNYGELHAYVFVPQGHGLAVGLTKAEAIAAAFRSWRENGVSCEGATVHPMGEGQQLAPPGLNSAAGNYACVLVSIPLYFDQTA